MRLLPRVGERPAGADMGLLEVLAKLLATFLTGDLAFRMVRGRDMAADLLKLVEAAPSFPASDGADVDFVRTSADGLKKSLPRPSELTLARLERSRAGSTFSRSLTLKKSVTLRLPGEVTIGIAVVGLASLRRIGGTHGRLRSHRPGTEQEVSIDQDGLEQG